MNYKKIFGINRFKVFGLVLQLPSAGAQCESSCLELDLKEMRNAFLKALFLNDLGMRFKAYCEMVWFYQCEAKAEGWAIKYEGDVNLFNRICALAYTFAGVLGADRWEVNVQSLKWADDKETK